MYRQEIKIIEYCKTSKSELDVFCLPLQILLTLLHHFLCPLGFQLGLVSGAQLKRREEKVRLGNLFPTWRDNELVSKYLDESQQLMSGILSTQHTLSLGSSNYSPPYPFKLSSSNNTLQALGYSTILLLNLSTNSFLPGSW